MTEATSTDVFMPPVCDSLEDGEQIALLRNESDDGSPADPFADSRFWNPALILLFMLTVNAMIYYDRGAISVTVPHIKNDTQIAGGSGQELTGGQAGLLGSAFMGGYMVFSPVFAVLANYIPPSQVMAIGTAGWVLAALSVSISSNYLWLLCSRVMVGIGEASFTGLAPSSIDNVAPPASKTLWLGLFFAAIPVGQALGIATGGVIAELGPLSIFGWKMSGWRLVFFLEAMVMLPLSCLCWVLPKQVNVKSADQELIDHPEGPEHPKPYGPHEAFWALLNNSTWLLVSLGYASYTFVIGALAFWGPTLVTQPPLKMDAATGSSIFGVTTAICGFLGTAAGGFINDWVGGGTKGALKFVFLSMVASFPVGLACFWTSSKGFFFGTLAMVELLLFNTQAPVNAVLLACVPTNLRNFSMSYNVLLIHLLGDTPSPYIVGQVSDWLKPHVGDHCLHAALIICYLWNLSSIAFYWAAWSTYGKGGRPRYSQGE